MAYTHLSTDELVIIEAYFHQNTSVSKISRLIGRARQTVHNVVTYLKEGHTALDYYKRYKVNKTHCGRKQIVLPENQQTYIKEKVAQGWTPDVIVGRQEYPIDCSERTLYRMFKRQVFDISVLPMKGKRNPNGYQERRGRQAFKRNIAERDNDYPTCKNEFGHMEGDTIVGVRHKSAVVTLIERMSKVIITLKPEGRTAKDIETAISVWLQNVPKNLFKSITFDCGKEFSNWRTISNEHDISIYFADPGTPSQRGLNEHSNGLLRRGGLPKEMDFNQVDQAFVSSVASKRNHIPRKSLNYRTPLEVFLSLVGMDNLSSLI
ncbi:IS30 family transposase [Aureibacillus halotolerans]|uniref:IS30 family transposase n=1 Tax=Aureibacillus halotolerans TaxID=1508390 RepID=A0A4R6TYP8_9BACI|nr:IS30 family transposase [Aureibacillus halotolerans]TDQ39080.1 IS30 family transposase [Aureibacillus halotolerans]